MTTSAKPNTSQKRMSQKGKGRKFFQQMQPTFAIDVPRTAVKLEFLDENDPAKDTIVRKKAREWVNKNRVISNQSRRRPNPTKKVEAQEKEDDSKVKETQLVRRNAGDPVINLGQIEALGAACLDPFSIFPDIGRKYGHLIDYFLSSSCPEEIPCSDDKYAVTPQNSLIHFSRDNTVLGNMAKSELSFILWLYATASIRDGILGSFDTEEIHWYCNKALKALQETLQKEMASGQYSDALVNSLACITATASFSGMFNTAILHRSALVRILTIRGDGDILKGIYTCEQWTRKAVQWCEIMVATQLIELPQVPYFHPYEMDPMPENVTIEAEGRIALTLSSLPKICQPLQSIIRLLHQLGLCYAKPPTMKKIDTFIIQPLYDAEYRLLKVLAEHKKEPFLSDVELLLAETFQVYFWTGPRKLPPQTRLCDLLVSRIIKALLVLVLEKVPEEVEYDPVMARGFEPPHPTGLDTIAKDLIHPRTTNNAILWCLAMGTMVSKALNRPEYYWLNGHFQLYMQAMGMSKSMEDYAGLLQLFPTTEGFSWIDLRGLYSTSTIDTASSQGI